MFSVLCLLSMSRLHRLDGHFVGGNAQLATRNTETLATPFIALAA